MRTAARLSRRFAMAAALVAAASVCTASGATLDVPFVPQGEDLCGGAAAAMVLRYWGERGVYAEAFAPLVDRAAGGIRTGALVGDLRGRGWTAIDEAGDLTALRRELGRGRPIIALLEVRPRHYHYVVVIGLTPQTVVLHDPARGPSRLISARDFEAEWAQSDHWMLILLPRGANGPANQSANGGADRGADRSPNRGASPSADRDTGSVTAVPGARSSERCDVSAAVARAADHDYASARRMLEDQTAACPGAAAPWRELAGVDSLEKKWDAAAGHARRAVDLDPGDAYAWRTLATADYLRHQDLAALDAWNRIGEPAVDLLDVQGLGSTRYSVIADAMRVAPGEMLTTDKLRLAERRARDVPSIAIAHVTFHPVESGRAQVDAAVVERDRAPATYPAWIAIGLDAAANREVSASFANPTSGGDLFSTSWRWWTHRPMIAAAYSAPAPRGLGGGTWGVEALHETQTFSPGFVEETRTRAALDISRWLTASARISGAVGFENWTGLGNTPALSGRVELWPVPDRLEFDGGATRWVSRLGPSTSAFGSGHAALKWRSSASTSGFVWLADTGYQFATDSAPASVWPGADTGHARDVLLRAHPLLNGGVIVAPGQGRTSGAFGRRLLYANAEVQRWQMAGKWPARVAPAAFVDLARATDAFGGASMPTQVDVGAGMRLSLLGLGMLRVDIARGLRDGRTAASIGFVK